MAKSKKRVSRKKVPVSSTAELPAEEETRSTVNFHYIKSNCFRVIRVDGAHGSPTPRGDIQMALFSERHPIPKAEEYALTEDGQLGKRINVTTRGAIVREVEIEAILSVEMARRLEIWLHDKVEQIERLRAKGTNDG